MPSPEDGHKLTEHFARLQSLIKSLSVALYNPLDTHTHIYVAVLTF